MTQKQANEIIEILKRAAEENSKSKARAIQSLKDAGILTEEGEVSAVYRTPESA